MQSKNYFRAGQEADFKIPDLFVKLDEQEKQKTPRQVKSAAGGIIVLQGRVPKVGPLVIKDGRTVGDGRTVNDGHTVRDAAMIKDGRTIEDGRVRTDSETRKNFTAPVFQEMHRDQEFLITPETESSRRPAGFSDYTQTRQDTFLGSREELVRAFVLAEILGKPRGLRGWEEEERF